MDESINLQRGPVRNFFHHNKCLVLLITIMIWMILQPFIEFIPHVREYFVFTYLIFMMLGPYIISGKRLMLYLTLPIGIPALALYTVHHATEVSQLIIPLGIVALLFDILITTTLIWYITTSNRFTKDLIWGGIFTYVCLILSFSDAYYTLDKLGMATFYDNVAGKVFNAISLFDSFYYSFTVITTLGFGDILPVNHLAKRLSSIEAMIGVLYVAIFIGRLIGLYNHDLSMKTDKNSETDKIQ